MRDLLISVTIFPSATAWHVLLLYVIPAVVLYTKLSTVWKRWSGFLRVCVDPDIKYIVCCEIKEYVLTFEHLHLMLKKPNQSILENIPGMTIAMIQIPLFTTFAHQLAIMEKLSSK
jgi:hypothetical protein